ncbi:MAG: AbrB/MazE/SpoVT family DNA-binding domain-containing protein [Leifsonia sp.]
MTVPRRHHHLGRPPLDILDEQWFLHRQNPSGENVLGADLAWCLQCEHDEVETGEDRKLAGVRIPKSMLDEAEIDGDIELRVVDGEIHISAVEPETGMTFLLLSREALSDWDRPEEDEAWADL